MSFGLLVLPSSVQVCKCLKVPHSTLPGCSSQAKVRQAGGGASACPCPPLRASGDRTLESPESPNRGCGGAASGRSGRVGVSAGSHPAGHCHLLAA